MSWSLLLMLHCVQRESPYQENLHEVRAKFTQQGTSCGKSGSSKHDSLSYGNGSIGALRSWGT